MAEATGISWTKSTFNPWIGCTKVSPGCDHCYAEALDRRHRWGGIVHWGVGVPRMRTRQANWDKLLKWNREAPASEFAGRLGFWPVFCASLADVFDNEVPQAWREDLWRLVDATPNLSWLIVTKRIGNVERMVPPAWVSYGFPRHVRILISVVNQDEADRDVPKLLRLYCRNGISYEPALGPVDWRPWLQPAGDAHGVGGHGIQWMIVGAESAQGRAPARDFHLSWARTTLEQCFAARVPPFVKQLGPRPIIDPRGGSCLVLKDRAGADRDEWPLDLQIQEFPL